MTTPSFTHPAGWPAYEATVRRSDGLIHDRLTFYYPADATEAQLVCRVLSIWTPARDNSGAPVASLVIAPVQREDARWAA